METLNLQSRQKDLLSVLNKKHGAVSGKELAAALDVSERTIRSDIKEINSQLDKYGIRICPLYGKGYSLSIKDRAVFVELFSQSDSYASKEDRVRTLLIRLLHEDVWCELGTLEDEMFISRTTLENDLKTVKKKISARHPYLQMERKGNFVRLENNEIKRRDILIGLYSQYWDYDSREGIVLKREEFGSELLRSIQKALMSALLKFNVPLDDSAYIYLTLSITIMYSRVKSGHPIRHTEVSRSDSDISEIIRSVLNTLNLEWGFDLKKAEYIWLSDILKQLIQLCDQSYSKNRLLDNTDVVCHHIVNDLLKKIDEEYGVDYTFDDHLFVDLTRHVQALFDGVIAPQILNHVLGSELRRKYPFLGDIVHMSRKYFEEQCEIDLGDNEEDYLFPFFISAQRTMFKKARQNGLTVSVISHTNGSVTHYLMEQLTMFYGNELDLRGPYPVYAKENCTADNPDFLISTVQTKNFSSVFKAPVVTISSLLEQDDRHKVNRCIDRIMCERLYGKLPKDLNDYFRPDLVFSLNNKESLVSTLSVIKEQMTSKSKTGKIRSANPDKDYYTLLKNGLLFIYQIDNNINEPTAAFVSLNKTISWKHLRSVQTIMYVILPETQKRYLGWFYYIAKSLSDSSSPEEMIKNRLI